MTSEVVHYTPDELKARRAALIAQVGDTGQLMERAECHVMTPDERDVLLELEEIAFLLGEDA